MFKKIFTFFFDSLMAFFIFVISFGFMVFFIVQNSNTLTSSTDGLGTIIKIVCSFTFFCSFVPMFLSLSYIGIRLHTLKHREDKVPKIG